VIARGQRATLRNFAETNLNRFVEQTVITEDAQKGVVSGIDIIKWDSKIYYPANVPEYVEGNDEMKLFKAHLETGIPILLYGFKGTGKTLSLAKLASNLKCPIMQADCSENTKTRDLIGRFVIVGNEVMYQLGILPMAIELANREGQAILVLEELNALTPNMQKVLNQVLDWRGHVHVPEINKIFRLENGHKLLISATANPSTYGGIFELNEDLVSRFAKVIFDYPKERVEKEILTAYGCDENEMQQRLLTLAKETRTGELEYALSPRDIILVWKTYQAYKEQMSDEKALTHALENIVVSRYDDKDANATIRQRINSIFGTMI